MGNGLANVKRALILGSGIFALFLAVYRTRQAVRIASLHLKRFRMWASYLLASTILVRLQEKTP